MFSLARGIIQEENKNKSHRFSNRYQGQFLGGHDSHHCAGRHRERHIHADGSGSGVRSLFIRPFATLSIEN